MSNRETPAAYEHNGQRVSAEAFYAIACDPRRSVAVEACAGAGKTWMLVSRIVRALLGGVQADGTLGVQPHEILAITFTKRATSEMRERLYEWMGEFAGASQETLIRELQARGISDKNSVEPSSVLAEQLSKLYQSVLVNGRQVQIRTFHSWFAALLRSAPVALLQELELPVNYELLEDDAPARALVWRRFYAALLTEPPLKADFEAVVFEYGRSQTEKALQAALDKRTEFALADVHGVVDASVQRFSEQFADFVGLQTPDDYLTAVASHRLGLLDAAKALGAASAKTFSAKGMELEQAVGAGDVPAMLAALLTATGTARKFGEKIIGIESVRTAQDMALRVAAARLQDSAWQYQQRMARLSRLLIAQYGALKRERGWVDMNDVERAASRMLGDSVLAGWVQERLDARIKHLMIDEFQDTNPLQWQALRSWLGSYAGAGGAAPSVFIVGDPKQSIYRFRRAEPQVFKAAQAFVRDGLKGDLLSCDHTRRNATGVIAAVNAVMVQAGQDDGYEGFRAHTTGSLQPGRVCKLPPVPRPERGAEDGDATVGDTAQGAWRDSLTTPREVPEETLRTLEARQAANWIAGQLACPQAPESDAGLQAADVMVLSRRRAGLIPLQDELRKLNIAAQIGEKTDLIDCCEIQDVVALLDVLVSPQHDLSLARALKSPLFGLADEDLVPLALAQAQSKRPWFDLLQQTELLTSDGRELASVLVQWKCWLDQLPPHDALQAIYVDGDVLARFAVAAPATQREAVLANLRALLGVALQLGGGRFVTPYALVRALKGGGVLAPAALNPLAVRLLTIHGAKGLEAKTVLLLDTDTPERNAETMGVLVDWPGEAAWPVKFVFLASESHPPGCALPTLEAERLERQREELNALYVALTRARHTLVVSSIEPHRAAGRSWWQRLAPLATQLGSDPLLSPERASASAESAVFQLKELPPAPVESMHAAGNEVAISAPECIEEQADSAAARVGKAMHRLLEWGNTSSASVAAAAREFALEPGQGAQAQAMAERIIQGEGRWVWDNAAISWQGDEIELMVEGKIVRLDRLVQRCDDGHAGHWWVLDYKSSHAPQDQPALRAQLSSYRAAVQTIYPGDVVKAAFLTGQGALVEIDDNR